MDLRYTNILNFTVCIAKYTRARERNHTYQLLVDIVIQSFAHRIITQSGNDVRQLDLACEHISTTESENRRQIGCGCGDHKSVRVDERACLVSTRQRLHDRNQLSKRFILESNEHC